MVIGSQLQVTINVHIKEFLNFLSRLEIRLEKIQFISFAQKQ